MSMHGYSASLHVCHTQEEVNAVVRRAFPNGPFASVADWRNPQDPEGWRFPCLVQVTYLEHHSTYVAEEGVAVYVLGWKDIDRGVGDGHWPRPGFLKG
jgi:hypothetical protein